MKILKTGSVSFSPYGLVFTGWEVSGGTDREFQEEAIRRCAPNLFIRAAMLAAI